jgi:hypothetical protein
MSPPSGSEPSIAPYLRLLSSDIDDLSDRGAQLFLLASVKSTSLVLRHIPELKLIISCLCSCAQPRWGTVSSLTLAIANVISIQGSNQYAILHDLLEICRTITVSFLNAPSSDHPRPHILPFVQAIAKIVRSKTVDIDVVLALTEQCVLGFPPRCSFIPFMSQMAKDIVTEIRKCDPVHYGKLTQPISSGRLSVVRFYTLIWGWAIGDLLNRPPAITALSHHSQALITLAAGTEEPLAAAAKYLIDCIRVCPQAQTAKLPTIGVSLTKMIEDALAKKKQRQPVPVKPVEEPKPSAPVVPEAPPKPDLSGLKARIELTVVAKAKKKPIQCDLRLLPEARLLAWGQGVDIGEGDVVDLSDVKETAAAGPKQLKLTTIKTALTLIFAFADQPTADTWLAGIKEACSSPPPSH